MSTKNEILITGATGMLGARTVKYLLGQTSYNVVAVASSYEKMNDMLEREKIVDTGRLRLLSNSDFLKNDSNLSTVYGAVHFAFSRRTRPAENIASSLTFARAVFEKLGDMGVDRVINVSSQGVYGGTKEMRAEDTVPAPENIYTMAKYAAEILFDSVMESCGIKNFTNLRLDLVAQSQNIIKAFCQQAKAGKISIRGGEQRFSFIDADDAVEGIIAMIDSPDGWDRVYNLGWNRRRYTIVELANIIAGAAEHQGFGQVEITLDRQAIELWAGMDSSKFTCHTGWKPHRTLQMTIDELLRA